MIVQAILFWIFAVTAVASGVLVIAMRNPVHSVLFLIPVSYTHLTLPTICSV